MGLLWILCILIVLVAGEIFENSELITIDHSYYATANVYTKDKENENLILIFRAVSERNIQFYIYNRKRPNGYRVSRGDMRNLLNSGYDSTVPTKVIIHGYMSNYKSDAIQLPKHAYLSVNDFNVIAVDWSEYTFPYVAAANNARAVGHVIGKFIRFLVRDAGLRVNDLHIIGHSLGAHVAAFSVETIGAKPARITGLDPAAPVFSENSPIDRLGAEDAQFVDIIHTSVRLLGMVQAIGHVDFYPAGGKHQPRCPVDVIEEIIGTCDHLEAYIYFTESIINGDTFQAVQCKTLQDALAGQCQNGEQGVMGELAISRTNSGTYYVDVGFIKMRASFYS